MPMMMMKKSSAAMINNGIASSNESSVHYDVRSCVISISSGGMQKSKEEMEKKMNRLIVDFLLTSCAAANAILHQSADNDDVNLP